MICERLERCPFYKDEMGPVPVTAGLLKDTYCCGDKLSCARYQLALAGLPIPSDMMPNDHTKAMNILRNPPN